MEAFIVVDIIESNFIGPDDDGADKIAAKETVNQINNKDPSGVDKLTAVDAVVDEVREQSGHDACQDTHQ